MEQTICVFPDPTETDLMPATIHFLHVRFDVNRYLFAKALKQTTLKVSASIRSGLNLTGIASYGVLPWER